MKNAKVLKSKKGFTIIELVIVIAVIAILAAVLIPTFASVIAKSHESNARSRAKAAYSEIIVTKTGGNAEDFKLKAAASGVPGYKYQLVVETNDDHYTFDIDENGQLVVDPVSVVDGAISGASTLPAGYKDNLDDVNVIKTTIPVS